MNIRDWQPEDMERLAKFHREMNVGYALPPSFGPLYPVRKTVVDDEGNVIAMGTVKIVGEAFLWIDPTLSPYVRAKSLRALNHVCSEEARRLGFDEVSAWVPNRLLRCFSWTLERLGWRKSPWRTFTFVVK